MPPEYCSGGFSYARQPPEHRPREIQNDWYGFKWHMRQTRGRVFDLRHPLEAKNMKEMMDDPKNTTFKSPRDFRDGSYYWHRQEVDYVPSNLRRGFIFYFICNECGRRVKYLYEYSMLESPICRICCRLSYRQPNRKARAISRLFRRELLSQEAKWALIKKANITAADVLSANI